MQDSSGKDTIEFERGSGNVFADLGLSNPVERQAKARLMYAINSEIKRQGLRQTETPDRVGLSQPDISKIACGHGAAFSIDQLLQVLTKLGVEIKITLRHGNGGVKWYDESWTGGSPIGGGWQ